MQSLRNLWAGRPFWSKKLGQLWALVRESHATPLAGKPQPLVAAGPGQVGITWLGHSSFLLQMAGRHILIDPVYATRLVLLRRARRPGIAFEQLPRIDLVLLTHAHMDHLNRPTLRRLARRARKLGGLAPMAVVPRGVEDLVQDLGFREVHTMDWWEDLTLDGLHLTFTPAQHWGARMFKDTYRRFGGYLLTGPEGHRVYHAGDTAYFPGFREIGRRLHPQVALLPIGAYAPDSYRGVHTSPEDAMRGFADLGAELMIPMHFGTFRLGREPMAEPPVRLAAEASRLHLSDRVRILTEGETLLLQKPVALRETELLAHSGASNRA